MKFLQLSKDFQLRSKLLTVQVISTVVANSHVQYWNHSPYLCIFCRTHITCCAGILILDWQNAAITRGMPNMSWYSKTLYLTIIINNLFIPVTTDKYYHFFSFKKQRTLPSQTYELWLINLPNCIQFSNSVQILSELPLLNYCTCRISLLAYSPMAMGILSGKYHSSDDSGPPEARMNLFKGTNFFNF